MEPQTMQELTEGALIYQFIRQMTLVFIAVLLVYTIFLLPSWREKVVWYRANGFNIALCFVLFGVFSAGIVYVPKFADILGLFGFNAEQGTAGIGLIIAYGLIKGKQDISWLKGLPERTAQAKTDAEVPPDPIPNETLHQKDSPQGE